jgi:hypothetical protein
MIESISTNNLSISAERNAYGVGLSGLSIRVHFPYDPEWHAKGDAGGIPGILPNLTDACRELPAVKRFAPLGAQIAAAEAKVALAKIKFQQAEAAKVLLESNPEPDLANKLRAIEGEVTAAEESKAAAEVELAKIRYLVPKLWTNAAEAIRGHVNMATMRHRLTLHAPIGDAEEHVSQGLKQLAETIEAAVKKYVAESVDALGIAIAAEKFAHDKSDAAPAAIVGTILGAIPKGVRQVGGTRYEVEPAIAPPAKPGPAGVPENRRSFAMASI